MSLNQSFILISQKWLYHIVTCPKDADGLANSVDPDQTSSLIWVCTVYPDLCPKT